MIPFNEHEFALREDFMTSVAYLFKLHDKKHGFHHQQIFSEPNCMETKR